MIRIYDKEELGFTSLGLGSLDETLAAVVVEKLNGSYEMEMDYPITGRHFDKIQHRNIIFCKPNSHTSEQPFRIYNITKPLDGTVTVSAAHISYDASGVIILPKRNTETKVIEPFGDEVTIGEENGYQLDTILNDINDSAVANKNPFTMSRYDKLIDVNLPLGETKLNELKTEGYLIPMPMNLRSMLGGSKESMSDLFKGEYLFDKFNIKLYEKRGIDRGITIRYGKNMTDLEQDTSGENLFTAVFPFYSKAYSESSTSTTPIFQPTYIVPNTTPLRADWLSVDVVGDRNLGIGGIPFPPVVELFNVLVDGVNEAVGKLVAIRVKTPNSTNPVTNFYDKIYVFRKNTVELGNLIDVYIVENQEPFVLTWLSLTDGGDPLEPVFGNIYVVKTESADYLNKKFIFDGGIYVEYGSDGFYCEAKEVDSLDDEKKAALIAQYGQVLLPRYKISYNANLVEKWYADPINGSIYVRPYFPNVGTVTVDKYVYLDLIITLPIGSQWFDKDSNKLYTSTILNTWANAIEESITTITPSTIPGSIGARWFDEIKSILYVSVSEYTWSGAIQKILPTEQPIILTPADPVIMENGVMYINGELKALEMQKIYSLDLTEALDDIGGVSPTDMTQKMLFDKAEQYLKDNDFTKVKESLTISFIKLSDSQEYSQFKQLEVVELGDEINVIYEELGVNSKRRVISVEYDVLTGSYNEIELGDEIEKITNSIVSVGDNISSLKNDENFTNKQYVTQLIAENAQIINAEIQKAIIQTLQATNVNISGLLEASSGIIDDLIAQLITADYAEVAKVLAAGSIKVSGNITALSGNIGGCKIEDGKLLVTTSIRINDGVFEVDEFGNVIANSIKITGGENHFDEIININNSFEVDNYGNVKASAIKIIKAYADDIDVNNSLKATEIIAKKIFFGDRNLTMERISSEGGTETQQVIFYPHVGGLIQDPETGELFIGISATSNIAVWEDQVLVVSFKYSFNGHIYIGSGEVTIPSGASESIASSVQIYVLGYLVNGSSRIFPDQITEIRQTGTTDSLIVTINGVPYTLAGLATPGSGVTFFVKDTQPTIEEAKEGDFWYDTSTSE